MKLTLVVLSWVVWFQSPQALAAFDENSLRYLSPWDIVFKLKSTFPQFKGRANANSCSDLTSVADEFGANDPTTGSPIANSPSPLTIRWIEICTGELTASALPKDSSSWAKKSSQEQRKILSGLVRQILGEDEVITSFGLIVNVEKFVDKAVGDYAKDKGSTADIERRWALALVLRDEFLSY